MRITIQDIKEHGVGYYVDGAGKFLKAKLLPETPTSRARVEVCKKCPFYSENFRSAKTGTETCTICTCPIVEKAKTADVDPTEKCPMNYW